jgi:hypothetical protein
MKKMGYLALNPRSKKKGFAQRGQPKFIVVVNEEEHTKMMKECFDPTLHIQHHVSASSRP